MIEQLIKFASVAGTLIAVVGIVAFFIKAAPKTSSYPYVRAGALLSKPEAIFWKTLTDVVRQMETDWHVMAKIRVADIIEPKKGLEGKARMSALGRIAQKHVDFVLFHPTSCRVLMAIELDDASHAQRHRQERDRFLDKSFEAAGVPLLRYPTKDGLQNAEKLKSAVLDLLAPATLFP